MKAAVIRCLALSSITFMLPNAYAEQTDYSCYYTRATLSAPFLATAQERQCPENKCGYIIHVDNDTAIVNGVAGYVVTHQDTALILERHYQDPVMGGTNTTTITLHTSDLSFNAIKTTSPAVSLSTTGQCQ